MNGMKRSQSDKTLQYNSSGQQNEQPKCSVNEARVPRKGSSSRDLLQATSTQKGDTDVQQSGSKLRGLPAQSGTSIGAASHAMAAAHQTRASLPTASHSSPSTSKTTDNLGLHRLQPPAPEANSTQARGNRQFTMPDASRYRRAQTAEVTFTADDDSSSDDCEEETRRITAGVRRTNHQRNSSWFSSNSSTNKSVLSSSHAVDQQDQETHQVRDESTTSRAYQSPCMGQANDMRMCLMQDDPSAAAVDEGELRRRQRSSYHLTNSHAAVELFLRLSRARQTLDFAKRQANLFAQLDKGEMDVWEALDLLNELREYEAALLGPGSGLEPDMPLLDHAIQTAELCRLSYPDKDWMHLVGLLHGLGKLLAHRRFGSQPQWAVCGESFPLGCRFDTHISGAQFFIANPDKRRRAYNTQLGIYQPHCGLRHVFMSWSAAEYLYLILVLNETKLPSEALSLIRYQKFLSLTRSGSNPYQHLLSQDDEQTLPLLRDFQRLMTYRGVAIPPELQLSGDALKAYYNSLINKYIGREKLLW